MIGGGNFTYFYYDDIQGRHYVLGEIDMSFLVGRQYFVHGKYSCVNGVTVGNVPEPTLISKIGISLICLLVFRRKK